MWARQCRRWFYRIFCVLWSRILPTNKNNFQRGKKVRVNERSMAFQMHFGELKWKIDGDDKKRLRRSINFTSILCFLLGNRCILVVFVMCLCVDWKYSMNRRKWSVIYSSSWIRIKHSILIRTNAYHRYQHAILTAQSPNATGCYDEILQFSIV